MKNWIKTIIKAVVLWAFNDDLCSCIKDRKVAVKDLNIKFNFDRKI